MIFKTGFKAKATLVVIFAVAAIFAACSNPSSSSGDANASSAYVPRGSVIKGMYSGENGARVVFSTDGTVTFYEDVVASARAVYSSNDSDDDFCAHGAYIVIDNNIAQITIMEAQSNWSNIKQNELNGCMLSVKFDGNDLSIVVGKESLSFSTDKKDVYEPSSGSLFSNGRPIDATYLLRGTLTLNDENFSLTFNILYDFTEKTVQGTYKQSGNTITFNEPTLIGGDYAKEATATISSDTLTLIIKYDEESDIDKTVFKKGTSDKEWEHLEKLTLSSKGDVSYYVNGACCWKGKYTIIGIEAASVKLNEINIKNSFGTEPGNLYIDEADQKSLWLDLVDLDDRGGTAILFAREK